MGNVVKDIGAVSAYALAVEHGFKGTEAEWATLQMQAGENAQRAAAGADASEASAKRADEQAGSAAGSAQTAGNAAAAASASQQNASASAGQASASARSAQESASSAATSAQSAADDAAHAETAAARAETAAVALENVAPAIVCGETGEVIAVSDAAERPLNGLRVFGKTTQAGEPTPDNPQELVNVGGVGSIGVQVHGKNLVDLSGFEFDDDRYLHSHNMYTSVAANELFDFMKLNTGKTVILSAQTTGQKSGVDIGTLFFFNNNTTIFRLYPGTPLVVPDLPDSYTECGVYGSANGASAKNFQLEFGEAATAYEPYTEQSLTLSTPNGLQGIPVSSGGNYTDENGQQWVCDEIDLERGVYVQQVRQYSLPIADMDATANYPGWTMPLDILDCIPSNTNGFITMPYITNIGRGVSANMLGSQKRLWLEKSVYNMTMAEWKENHPDLVFEIMLALLAPVETPLSAEEIAAYRSLRSNKPNTTVFNDGGAGMQLDYTADTKIYIDRKFDALAAAIVNNA